MNIMRQVYLIIAICMSTSMLYSQNVDLDEFMLKGIIYRKEFSVDTRVHTNGFALAFNFGNIITYRRSKYYHIELGYISDPREQSQSRNIGFSFNSPSNSFKYGKQNALMVLRAGVGRKKFLSDKAKRKGVAIGYSYEIGPAIALLKPYYLDLQYQIENNGNTVVEVRSEKYSEENAEKFLTYRDIFGHSGFTKGLGEISFVPGAQAKAGFFFSLGAYDKIIKSVEVGVMADLFIKKIPIMVETENISNKPYFVNLYLHLQLGTRSN